MKTLRLKFILFAMAAVTILLLVLGLSINGLAWFMFERQADAMMETLVESEGNFMRRPPQDDDALPRDFRPPDMEIMRSARFFEVHISDSGEILFTNVEEIFYVSEDEAVEFTRKVLDKKMASGRIDRYKYAVKEMNDGKKVYFLDMTRENLTMRTLLIVSAVIAVISWLVVLLFVVLSSEKVVQPIVAGMEKQKRFITDAGHELKTPLAIIQSNNDANILLNGENKYSRNIKSQVVRLSDLTSDLLTLAKLDEGAAMTLGPVNVSDLVEEILPPYQDTAANRGLSMDSRIEKDITMHSHRESLVKLVSILMDNAIKYTDDGGDIRFDLKKEQNHVLIVEENSCAGHEAENPEQLFERFYRGDAARTQQNTSSGYGVGLSIAKMICENLGGTLTAEYPAENRIRFTAKLKK